MCEDISSTITKLYKEVEELRFLDIGVRPSNSLQQAPWWVQKPKEFTWLNVPLRADDDQIGKDLNRIGISRRNRAPSESEIRTPTPEPNPRKRKRRPHDHDRRDSYLVDDGLPTEPTNPEDGNSQLPSTPWTATPATPTAHRTEYDRRESGGLGRLLEAIEQQSYYRPPPPPPPPAPPPAPPQTPTSHSWPPPPTPNASSPYQTSPS